MERGQNNMNREEWVNIMVTCPSSHMDDCIGDKFRLYNLEESCINFFDSKSEQSLGYLIFIYTPHSIFWFMIISRNEQ